MKTVHVLVVLVTTCAATIHAAPSVTAGMFMGRLPHVTQANPANCNRTSLLFPADAETTVGMLAQMVEHTFAAFAPVLAIWERGDLEALLRLDRMNIRGSGIWLLFNDLCSKSLDCLVERIYSNASSLVEYVNSHRSKGCATVRLLEDDEAKTRRVHTEVPVETVILGHSYDCYRALDRQTETWHLWLSVCVFAACVLVVCVTSRNRSARVVARVWARQE
jgi:hypothetical protein